MLLYGFYRLQVKRMRSSDVSIQELPSSGSRLHELGSRHMATGSLIHKNENLTGRGGYVFE